MLFLQVAARHETSADLKLTTAIPNNLRKLSHITEATAGIGTFSRVPGVREFFMLVKWAGIEEI